MYNYRANVIRVVDADTLDLDVDIGFGIFTRQCVRLARIDAWEVRGEEKVKGRKAKAFVEDLLHPIKQVMIATTKERGKYGRYIAEIMVPKGDGYTNLSDLLVEEGHAREYEG